MTCCSEPAGGVLSSTKAACRNCGFTWAFGLQGKGKYKTKKPKWGPAYYCEDKYDRAWRMRGYDRHEVVGTRRRGKRVEYVVGCPKGTMFTINEQSPPDEAYCPECDRSGLLGPMVKRYQIRREE